MNDGPANSGARATDVLANERTFLAYLRTSLSFIAFGFVIARFALFTREIAVVLHTLQGAQRLSSGFGTAIALFGALIAAYGGPRLSRSWALPSASNSSPFVDLRPPKKDTGLYAAGGKVCALDHLIQPAW